MWLAAHCKRTLSREGLRRRWFVTLITSVGGRDCGLPDRSGQRPQGRGLFDEPRARQRDPGGAVLLLHRRDHVADPRRLHDLRDGHRAAQERARDGDEEHPHDRRRHADLLLLRLVDLQLQHAGPADRPEQHRFHRFGVSGRDPVVGHLRPEPDQQHQPRLLPRLPPLLLDDGFDHVRGPARAGAALGLSGPRRACSARSSGSSTPPGAGASAAGSRCASGSTTRSPRRSSTASPAPSRSGSSSTSGRGSASTRRRAWRAPSDPTTSI